VDVLQGLTASGFYSSNTIFHRVVPGFVIQGGDPQTNGLGGPVFRYDDEFNPRALFSGHGQLALANSGKDTDGSQFFVTIGSQRFLDLGYTLCGQLVRGFNVLTNIGTTPTNSDSRPLADVIITKASFVPNTTDTVLFLSASNLAGASGTIAVIADDGAGGRTTNTFTATTAGDANNEPPILYPATVTNRVGPVNARLTNIVSVVDLDGSAYYWFPFLLDGNATNSLFNNGQLVAVPNSNFVGTARFRVVVSSDPNWSFYSQILPPSQWPPYDWQIYSFAFGDSKILATGSNFVAQAATAFVDQAVASFPDGILTSPATNFTAFINWGDNSTNSGTILTNAAGKEVRGSHTYTNAGHYPVYVTIRSTVGADATVVSTAMIPPRLDFARSGTDSVLRWPAWATDYQLQSQTNVGAAVWNAVTNPSSLMGYESVATNSSAADKLFFRLRK
jgi:peptidyl-prolyl cis-trans isomerase A (cyclophilin A)